MFLFGSGIMWGTPLTDAAGAAIANPTPLIFGTMQDVAIDIGFEIKQLHGQNQFPVAVGRGKGSVTGTAKLADIRSAFLETIVFGVAGTAGLTTMVYDTVGTAVPTTPFTITVTPPGGGTFAADLGVISAVTGRALTRVAASPATGQYTVSGSGAYVFAAADTGLLMFISYRYTATSTVARRMDIGNRPMGTAPAFRADFFGPYMGHSAVLTLNNCIAGGFKLGTAQDDFTVPEMNFTAFANVAGVVGTLAISE